MTSRYFAVIDPADPARMTFWRESERGRRPWPPKSRPYGLTFHDQYKAAPTRDERIQLLTAWHEAVDAEITARPDLASARFAAWHSRCCCCGRTLTDPTSKTYGIGPECRTGLPDFMLTAMAEQMRHVVGTSQLKATEYTAKQDENSTFCCTPQHDH